MAVTILNLLSQVISAMSTRDGHLLDLMFTLEQMAHDLDTGGIVTNS